MNAFLVSLIVVFGTIPGISPSPFTRDATVSYHGGSNPPQTIPLYYGWSPLGAIGDRAPKAGVRIDPQTGQPLAQTSGVTEEGMVCDLEDPPPDGDIITECRGHCRVPDESEISGWRNIYRIYYGIQLEQMNQWAWPGSAIGEYTEALNHLEALLQTVHASVLRDFGVELQVQHVHIVYEGFSGNALAVMETEEVWQQLSPSFPVEVQGVMRLNTSPGGQAGRATCLDGIKVGRSNYQFDADPLHATASNNRNSVLYVLAQELMHQLLVLEHTQCYLLDNGDPIEKCTEFGGTSSCYRLNRVCPPKKDVSYMGYCRECFTPHHTELGGLPGYANLRIGPAYGPMARVARYNAEGLAVQCIGPRVARKPVNWDSQDTDGDEYPDKLDNCPSVANNEQVDSDTDGIGNACESCAIVQPTGKISLIWLSVIAGCLFMTRHRNRRI